MDQGTPSSRRGFLRLGAGLTGAVALATAARADVPEMSKASVGYRDVPQNGQVCAQCVYFIFAPATGTVPASRCKLVAGPISPAGWCQIWSPKG